MQQQMAQLMSKMMELKDKDAPKPFTILTTEAINKILDKIVAAFKANEKIDDAELVSFKQNTVKNTLETLSPIWKSYPPILIKLDSALYAVAK